MTMTDVAELGYFIIKYIQNFNLDGAVGVDERHPVHIRFIPDNRQNGKPDYQADDQMLNEFDERTNVRLNSLKDETFKL
jgi:hypothetical protein